MEVFSRVLRSSMQRIHEFIVERIGVVIVTLVPCRIMSQREFANSESIIEVSA